MGKINLSRVILGGIVAGIVIDVFEGILHGAILASQWADVLAGLGKGGTMSVKQIVAFNVWGLAVGILTVGLYAAIRPRFGAGPRTAVLAGLAVWALAYVMGDATPVFLHMFPVGTISTSLVVEAVIMAIAGVAGAAVYKESAAEAIAARVAGASY
jgi:hypothetical protein